jgi:hypothetical protein
VVLDRDSHTLHLPGRDVVDAGFADAVLQIPGESSESVTLATPTELLVVPLQDAEIQRISSGASSKGGNSRTRRARRVQVCRLGWCRPLCSRLPRRDR